MRFALLALVATTQVPVSPRAAEPLDSMARAYVAAGKTEGISVVTVHCGTTRFVQAGVASPNKSPNADTVFEIGSLSKLFTGFLLAKAVTQGRASLQDDVRRFLPPGFPNLQWEDGTPITLGNLADTTSGLPDYLPDPVALAKLPEDQVLPEASRLLAGYSDDAFLRDLRTVKLLARPGTTVRHSNVAAQLLGLVLSRIYDKPYAGLLRQELEVPLGMQRGTMPQNSGQVALGHDGGGRPAPTFTGPSVMPAGGLRYSARDMGRFVRRQLSGDAAVRLSHRKRAAGEDGDVAFTWLISSPRPGVQRYRLTGSTFGFSSYIEVYPALGYGAVLLANRGAGDVQNELMAMAERAFDGRAAKGCS